VDVGRGSGAGWRVVAVGRREVVVDKSVGREAGTVVLRRPAQGGGVGLSSPWPRAWAKVKGVAVSRMSCFKE